TEEELLWALRGGGGNFGVVTAMHLRLHELETVHTGMLLFPFSEAGTVLRGCAEIASSATDELTVQLGLVLGADSVPLIMIVPTWCGPPDEGEVRIAPFLGLGKLLGGTVSTIPYCTSLTLFDSFLANGKRQIMETCWIPELDKTSMEALIHAIAAAASPGC